MRSIDRIRSTIQFDRTDRVPVFSHIYGFATKQEGLSLKDYLNKGEIIALCQLESRKRFGYDAVVAFADTSLEAEALGSKITYREEGYPYIEEYCLKDVNDWRYLSIADPEADGRMPVILEACRILKAEAGEEAVVVGTVQGPMTLAWQLLGMEKLMYSIADHPIQFDNLLNLTAETTITFGRAIMKTGAHIIQVFDPAASCSVINREVFRDFILPKLKKVFKEFKDIGEAICWLNITGQSSPILDLYQETGADLFNIDYLVPISLAIKKLPGLCINGNIKPLSFVSAESEDMEREVTDLLEQTSSRGGFILSPGCEIPLESKASNIDAMVHAAKARND